MAKKILKMVGRTAIGYGIIPVVITVLYFICKVVNWLTNKYMSFCRKAIEYIINDVGLKHWIIGSIIGLLIGLFIVAIGEMIIQKSSQFFRKKRGV